MLAQIIPTKVHGVLDYLVGVALLLAPTIFGFKDVGGMAVVLPMVLGVGLIVYSIFTRYELGLVKVLPMKFHLMFDLAASVLLAASPFIFGFSDEALNAWLPHVVVGLTVILVVLISQSEAPVAERAAL